MSGVVFFVLGILAAGLVFPGAEAADFLHAGQVNSTQLEKDLLAELADALRPGASNVRIDELTGNLSKLFASVPAESDGTLNHHVVRYVLHRFFVQKHGWFIRGLEPDGDHRDDASEDSHAMSDLQEWVPGYLSKFLEQLNAGKGLSLKEVSVFAATLEDLIHKEAIQRLEVAWKALGWPLDKKLYTSQTKKVLDTYMLIYNSGGEMNAETPEQLEELLQKYAASAKDWWATQAWIRKVRNEVYPFDSGRSNLNFTQMSYLVEQLGERYGAFNDEDCSKLKTVLLSAESKTRIGRIKLADFYKKGLYSSWEFNEKKEYLRSLGTLDESDPKQTYVIVPNYVASRPNCLVCSNFYVVCCRNECEDIMTQVEAELVDHTVGPEAIVRLIARIAKTRDGNSKRLSDSLLDRLREVAKANGGKVPIHGRLFAQWMHHVFPRDCPFPHEAGTTSPQTPDEWMLAAGHDSHTATEEERQAHVDGHVEDAEEDHELPWSFTEELLHKRVSPVKRSPALAAFRKVAVLGVVGAMLTWATLQARNLKDAEPYSYKKMGGLKHE